MSGSLTISKEAQFTSTGQKSRNSTKTFLSLPKLMRLRVKPKLPKELMAELTDRQELLEWWNQKKANGSKVCVIGSGGLGGHINRTLVQMGIPISAVDHDIVEISNLNRQFFTLEDVGQPKPHALIRRIAPFATRAMTLRSYWMTAEQFAFRHLGKKPYSAYCIGVDNPKGNLDGAKIGLHQDRPVVFINVSRDGDCCRVFIQRPGEACFACYEPKALEPPKPTVGCPRTPAIADILQVAAGFAVRAVVGEILSVPIGDFNCRDIALSGFDYMRRIPRNRDCQLCGG